MTIQGKVNRLVKNTFQKFGYDIGIRKLVKPCCAIEYTGEYEIPLFICNYAPQLKDKLFNNVFEIVRPYSMVDIYRLYELWLMVEETSTLEGAIIEIGTWRGGSGALIAKKAELLGIKDKVYLCDTFKGVVKAGKMDLDGNHRGGECADTSIELVKEVLNKLDLKKVEILTGMFPEDTGHLVKEKKIRLAHIDVDVYQGSKDCLEWVWKRLVKGGIVVFDDYGFGASCGVTRFVNEQRKKKDRIVIYNLNGHGLIIKR